MGDTLGFIDAYRGLGGIVNLVYFPRWYWGQIGSPSLSGLASRKCALWSSAYTGYTDDGHGTGWMPYGGLTPAIWQYTDAHAFNGYSGGLQRLPGHPGPAEAPRRRRAPARRPPGRCSPARHPRSPTRPGTTSASRPHPPTATPATTAAPTPLQWRRGRPRCTAAGGRPSPRTAATDPSPTRPAARSRRRRGCRRRAVRRRHLDGRLDRAGHPLMTVTPKIEPGTVLVTRSGGFAAFMIRLGAALRGRPNLGNHVAVAHHVDAKGTLWVIEGQARAGSDGVTQPPT